MSPSLFREGFGSCGDQHPWPISRDGAGKPVPAHPNLSAPGSRAGCGQLGERQGRCSTHIRFEVLWMGG